MPESQHAIDIAILQTKVEQQASDIAELKAMIKALGDKVDGIASQLTEAKGGWKFLMLLGGAGASVGAGLATVVSLFHTAPK